MKTLNRSSKNKVFAGICGGLGEYFDLDPVIIRILFVAAFFTLFPFMAISYLVLWIVLPREKVLEEKTASTENSEDKKVENKKGHSFMSIIMGLLIVGLGLYFLIPGAFYRIGDVGSVVLALLLFFVAGRLLTTMIVGKDFSLLRVCFVFISFSYGLFIILNLFSLVQYGIYFEYAKNLIPAILIAIGITIVFKVVPNKIPALVLTSVVFLFVLIFSLARGNYEPFGFMQKFKMPHFQRWMMKSSHSGAGNFQGSYALPLSSDNFVYRIKNSFGNLRVEKGEKYCEWSGSGIAPEVTTNVSGKNFELKFDSEASDTRMQIAPGRIDQLFLEVSAGNLTGDLRNISIEELKINVSGGSVDLDVGEDVKKILIDNNLGRASLYLPKKAKIKIKSQEKLSTLSLPPEFKTIDGEAFYDGNGKEIDITAIVNMGSLELNWK
jgi:phage shock protein C